MFGATGPFYAIRRELAVPIPDDMLLDDMYLPLSVFFRGFRLIMDSRARAFDYLWTSLETEFRRKVRRQLAGNYQNPDGVSGAAWAREPNVAALHVLQVRTLAVAVVPDRPGDRFVLASGAVAMDHAGRASGCLLVRLYRSMDSARAAQIYLVSGAHFYHHDDRRFARALCVRGSREVAVESHVGEPALIREDK